MDYDKASLPIGNEEPIASLTRTASSKRNKKKGKKKSTERKKKSTKGKKKPTKGKKKR
tara:strand:+ start:313 stop:486 length:174 start_codon:yes stop_codon:yes gene_type:complete